MTESFRRRLIGYAPAAVAGRVEEQRAKHSREVAALKEELAKVRARNAQLQEQAAQANSQLRAADEEACSLLARAAEQLQRGAGSIAAFMERTAAAEGALEAEIARLKGILAQLDEVRSRLGAEVESLSQRYRDLLASMRAAVCGTAAEPEHHQTDQEPRKGSVGR